MSALLVYIHGFQSSPLSAKAQETRCYVENTGLDVEVAVPALSDYPGESYWQLQQLVHDNLQRQIALIGSSLGGFMATALAEEFGLKAVLVNPSVHPYRLIDTHYGENTNPYTGKIFYLDEGHAQELHRLKVDGFSRSENLLVMLQKGDETLDYREAAEHYCSCQQMVEEGGDHRFQGFDKHLPAIMKFLELS